VLHSELGDRVRQDDAALATELTLGVLRWRGLLDFFLERSLKKPVARLDLPVAIALRMGLYQLRFLGRIPARAAVNESVELVKRARKTSATSLVNAVLRRATAEAKEPAEKFLPAGIPPAERLGIVHSHPAWLVERWLARFGELETASLLQANNRTPRLSCSVHNVKRRDDILNGLQESGLRLESGLLLKGAARLGQKRSNGEIFQFRTKLRRQFHCYSTCSRAIELLICVPRREERRQHSRATPERMG
ncbi:MAG: transcription antitermination factor NusB, partial [Candidatus Acidiferrales bacterium]